jgi:hypothetical protein
LARTATLSGQSRGQGKTQSRRQVSHTWTVQPLVRIVTQTWQPHVIMTAACFGTATWSGQQRGQGSLMVIIPCGQDSYISSQEQPRDQDSCMVRVVKCAGQSRRQDSHVDRMLLARIVR